MKVVATAMGFIDGGRIRPGTVFELDESILKRDADGNVILPKWVLPADDDSIAYVAGAADREAQKMIDAARASAGKSARFVERPVTPFGKGS